MTTEIVKVAGYTVRASTSKIPTGHYQLKLESRYTDSKKPDAWRTIADVTCEDWGLEALAEEIYSTLRESQCDTFSTALSKTALLPLVIARQQASQPKSCKTGPSASPTCTSTPTGSL